MTSPTDDRVRRSFAYAADVEAIALARREVSDFVIEQLRSEGPRSGEEVRWLVDRLGLVVSELCSNAVEAAPGRWFQVGITIVDSAEAAGVTCSVTNPHTRGDSRVLRFGDVPDAMAERGRGLVIVDGLADRTWVEQTSDLTVVTSELRLGAHD